MMNDHPFLSGNYAPVEQELTALDLPVTGAIPPELRGRFLRIGPNPVQTPDLARYHWFLGNGMVHGLRVRDGRAEWYRNRFVRDDHVTRVKGWPRTPGPRHGLFDGIANTNVIGHAGRTFAIVEGGALPVELGYELETVAMSDFGGTLPSGFSAHPKRDPDTGELHTVVYYWQWNHLQYVVVGADARVRRVVEVPVPGMPMVHDCAITERYVILLDLPCTFDLEAAAKSDFPYVWNPSYGARVGLLPRDGDAAQISWLDVPLCMVFHTLNAYDTADGRVVLDVCRYPRMFASDLRGPNEDPATLVRWVLDPASGRAHEECLDDRAQEFPRQDERRLGKPIRYAYTAALGGDPGTCPIYKHDLQRRTGETYDPGKGRFLFEPVFVPRAPDAGEDDGWVMAYVYDAPSNRSDVVILAAQDFSAGPLATIHLPERVPFGFHGNWAPDAG
jgi:carotenoid cleavage dioxygenase-like enzyme